MARSASLLARIASRPLVVAGPAAVLGVALSGLSPAWAGALAVALVALAAVRRAAVAALAGAALVAGFAAGVSERASTDRTLATMDTLWPRAPPGPVRATLTVTRCGLDPFHGRAWLEGMPPEGPGLRCLFEGALPDGLGPGALVRVAGTCRPFAPPGNPGESDRRLAHARHGVAVQCELRTGENVEVLERAPWTFRGVLGRARRAAEARLCASMPRDVAPLAVAFLTGDRAGLDDEDRLAFERTGTAHILAISGMHVLLLAAMVHALLRAAGLGPRAAAAVTFALALAYVPVAGAGAPVRRAVAVLAFHALALLRGRPPDAPSALGGAALLLAITDPAEMLGVGSLLSFTAALGILCLAGPWRDRWSGRYRLLRRFPAVRQDRRVLLPVTGYLLAAFPVSLAAWLTTLAPVARAFGVVTPYAVVMNLLAGPLASLFLAASALVALAVPGAGLLATLLARTLRLLLAKGAGLPGSLWVVAPPPLVAVVLAVTGCLLLHARPRLAAALLVLSVALAVHARPGPPARTELTLLDVGHGQAALLRTPGGRTVLVDGGSRTRHGVTRAILLPALRALSVRRIDLLVVTHADADHWNALPLLLRRFPVGRVVTGPAPPDALVRAARVAQVPLAPARPRDVLVDEPRARLTVLAAGEGGVSENDASVALLVESRDERLLLPADREEEGLRRLLGLGLPRCDVLVAPHHGARCDEAGALGRALRPDVLLVSGTRAFPDPPTLLAYGAARVLVTADAGAVRVVFRGQRSLDVQPFRRIDRATIRAP
jgi:competence protein ComEC